MNILVIDDERRVLVTFEKTVQKVFPQAEIFAFTDEYEFLEQAEALVEQGEEIQYAFLDIELCEMNGIELGKKLKEKSPMTKILFCTAYSEYACESYQMHAIGYLLKPVSSEMIIDTLKVMDVSWIEEGRTALETQKDIRVQTFGHFAFFVDGKLIEFDREKAKELLAYLIDRNGASVTNADIAAALWEEESYDVKMKNRVTSIVSVMRKGLKEVGAENILIKTWNHLAVDMSKLKCDRNDLEAGDVIAMNAYHGEYMNNYSWAEFTNGSLYELKEGQGDR